MIAWVYLINKEDSITKEIILELTEYVPPTITVMPLPVGGQDNPTNVYKAFCFLDMKHIDRKDEIQELLSTICSEKNTGQYLHTYALPDGNEIQSVCPSYRISESIYA